MKKIINKLFQKFWGLFGYVRVYKFNYLIKSKWVGPTVVLLGSKGLPFIEDTPNILNKTHYEHKEEI